MMHIMEKKIKRPRKIGQVITENILTCIRCNHQHDENEMISHHNKRKVRVLSCVCDKCHYPMRLSKTSRGFYVFSNQEQKPRYNSIDWREVFKEASVHIPEDVKNWLIENYTPPRKVNRS